MLKNMKIRTRMIVSYLIIVALLLVAGITSIVMLQSVGGNLQSFYDNQFATVENAMDARRLVFSVRSDLLAGIIEEDDAIIREHTKAARDEFAQIKEDMILIDETFAGDQSLIDNTNKLLQEAEGYLNEVTDLCDAERNDEAMKEFNEQYKPIMDTVRENLNKIGETAEENADKKVDDGMALANTATIIIIVLVVVAVVISVVLALFMSEGIRKPVQEMGAVCSEMCKGNMNVEIKYQSKDELGEMADDLRELTASVQAIIKDVSHCFGEMARGNFTVDSQSKQSYVGDYRSILDDFVALRDNMSDTLTQIDVASDQVNSGGEQVSSSAQALAQGATEQAASVQELAATANSITEQVKATTENARTAETQNRNAETEIQVCSQHMAELVAAMDEISDKSKEISKVIKTIEDIAFQTNILALNAAVEAARAGAAGKGFAVVADEVRNLATKSQEAAGSTTTLIGETVKAVENGSAISAETSKSLQKVVEDSQVVLDAVVSIAAATTEQSEAIAQMTTGIDQISSVVQTNSATAEESAAASEQLSAQAKLLKEMVGRFTLPSSASSSLAGVGAHRPSASVDHFSMGGGDKY